MNALVLFALTVTVSAVVATHDVSEDCWDTGCQLDTWKVRGCEQYGRYAKATRPCKGGTIYTCCKKESEEEVEHPTVMSVDENRLMKRATLNCDGVLKCLKSEEAGCKSVSEIVVKKMKSEPCLKNFVYSCCPNPTLDNDPTIIY